MEIEPIAVFNSASHNYLNANILNVTAKIQYITNKIRNTEQCFRAKRNAKLLWIKLNDLGQSRGIFCDRGPTFTEPVTQIAKNSPLNDTFKSGLIS